MESKQREIGRQDTSGGNMNARPNWANMHETIASISPLRRKQVGHKTKTSLVVGMSSDRMERAYVQRLIGQKECCMRQLLLSNLRWMSVIPIWKIDFSSSTTSSI